MREQRVDAGLRRRRMEDELGFAAFLRYGVVAGDRDLRVGLAIRGDTVAEESVVDCISQRRESQGGCNSNDDHALQPTFDSSTQHSGHRRAIIPAGWRWMSRAQAAVCPIGFVSLPR